MEPALDSSDWIICLRSERLVLHGAVECPRQGGREIPLSACQDCRLLEYARGERDGPDSCSTEPEAEPGLR
jgi:hypothetical protein